MYYFLKNNLSNILWLASFVLVIYGQNPKNPRRKFTPSHLRKLGVVKNFSLNPDGTKAIYVSDKYDMVAEENIKTYNVVDLETGNIRRLPTSRYMTRVNDFQWLSNNIIGFSIHRHGQLSFGTIDTFQNDWPETELVTVSAPYPLVVRYCEEQEILIYVVEDELNRNRPYGGGTKRIYNKLPISESKMTASGQIIMIRPNDSHTDGVERVNLSKLVPGDPHEINYFSMSKDGSLVAMAFLISSDAPECLIVVIDSNTLEKRAFIKLDATEHIPIMHFSPDSRFLVWVASPGSYDAMAKNLIFCYELSTGTKTILNENWDRSPLDFMFNRNGSQIVVSVEDKGNVALFLMDLEKAPPVRVTEKGVFYSIGSDKLDNLLAVGSSATHPGEIFRLAPHRGGWTKTQLTNFHSRDLAPFKFSEAEWFEFIGSNNESVNGLIIKPANLDPNRKYPMVLMIRGAPGISSLDHWDDAWNHQVVAQAGYVVVDINYHGSTGYGEEFSHSLINHPLDLAHRDIIQGVHYVLCRYNFINRDRIAAWGHSYGGYIVNYINGQNKDQLFKVLISYNGIFDSKNMFYTSDEYKTAVLIMGSRPYDVINDPVNYKNSLYYVYSPSTYVRDWKTPTLVVQSSADRTVSYGEGAAIYTALQSQNVPSKFLLFDYEEHTLSNPTNIYEFYVEALNFTQYWLNKASSYKLISDPSKTNLII